MRYILPVRNKEKSSEVIVLYDSGFIQSEYLYIYLSCTLKNSIIIILLYTVLSQKSGALWVNDEQGRGQIFLGGEGQGMAGIIVFFLPRKKMCKLFWKNTYVEA